MFSKHAIRLLREKWPNAQKLAEELFAILSDGELPLEHSGPIVLKKGEGESGLTLRGFGDSDTTIKIDRGDTNSPITITIGGIDMGDTNITNLGDEGDVLQVEEGGGGVAIGTVVEQLDGAVYSVLLAGEDDPVEVTQMDIAEGEVIPAGTVTPVFQIDGDLWMQVPVWL